MTTKTLQFTIGPVQGYVAQARRTRDLWAGSFLLSYLTAHAMKVVIDAEGSIEKPIVANDPILEQLQGNAITNPIIGSLPNQFTASVAEGFNPEDCRTALIGKWTEIADKVWTDFVESTATKYGSKQTKTKEIWDRQVANFWDIAWVIGDSSTDADSSEKSLLDMRKNWRSHYPLIEGGDHCTIMGDWQEISGHIKTYVDDDGTNYQKRFWTKLREVKGISVLDISEHEKLCAISLIKRLYPKPDICNDLIWEMKVKNWPSSSYMAAADWIRKIYPDPRNPEEANKDNKVICDDYVTFIQTTFKEVAKDSDGSPSEIYSEYATELESLEYTGKFGSLDGGFFFDSALENPATVPFIKDIGDESDEVKEARNQVIKQLQKLYTQVGEKPSPYFALVAMDGDRLGALSRFLENKKDQSLISKSLAKFSQQVPTIVRQNMGVTIYAGGDDVLAMFPLSKAITAAAHIRKIYSDSFRQICEGNPKQDEIVAKATLSGGIVFANQRITKRAVIAEANRLLNNVAKDKNGRDSLAISVLAGSGRTVEWVSTWKKHQDDNSSKVAELISDLATASTAHYPKNFFYRFRDRFAALLDDDSSSIKNLPCLEIFTAEYMKSREQQVSRSAAEERVGNLLSVCYERTRDAQGNIVENDNIVKVDGALLIRFLITKGLEQ